jgi:hypothetical protein
MNNKLLLILVISLATCISKAQTSCGTMFFAGQQTLEKTFTVQQAVNGESLPAYDRTLSVCVFVVNNRNNVPGIKDDSIRWAISNLSEYFGRGGIKFQLDTIYHVANYQFDSLFMGESYNEKDLTIQNYVPRIINIYFTTYVYDRYLYRVNGCTYFPGDQQLNTIFLTKSAVQGSELAHQMGHFLNLYHTHEQTFGKDFVTSTSCATFGDRCCDTDPDGNLEKKVDSGCVYTGNAKGPDGVFYNPSPKNMMSLSNDNCRCYFSNTQFLRMMYCIDNIRTDLR